LIFHVLFRAQNAIESMKGGVSAPTTQPEKTMSALNVRLGLEVLDSRNAPSDIGGNAVASTDWMTDPTEGDKLPAYVGYSRNSPPANAAPVILDFKVSVGVGNVGKYTGTVQDEAPAGLTVTLSGAQDCIDPDVTVTTDANGKFTFQGQLRPTLDVGYAYADVSDAQGAAAQTASYMVFC
jgi:hypothetical protein